MKQRMKRAIAALACAAVVVTMIPMSAFATEVDQADVESQDMEVQVVSDQDMDEGFDLEAAAETALEAEEEAEAEAEEAEAEEISETEPETSIEDYGTFVEKLAMLEELAMMYAMENPGKDANALVIKYIRTGVDRYNSGSWGIMAGYEDKDFAKFVQDMQDMILEENGVDLDIDAMKNIEIMQIPNGQTVDLGHMFGTMDITYHNNYGVNHADVAGWAGDLVDLLSATDRHSVSGTVAEMTKEIRDNYLNNSLNGEKDTFGLTDMYGDLDAFYVMKKLEKAGEMEYPLTTIISEYFTETLNDKDRAEFLIKNRFDETYFRGDLREAVYKAYTGNSVISTLEGTREFISSDLTDLRKACCYAFADYICELAGDYVEPGENKVFEVFQSETTKLAPGIIQKIKHATSADGKQMVFYTTTVDINRDDVNVYANYSNNDPSKGWAMSRVEDQMKAAEDKYANPESDKYIKDYTVIAGINGSGYNMQTGEPSGLLVMGGKEYHGINSSGFFGILKNGKAVIGTQAEYNTIYKDQVAEGIAGFGSTLVKDGKVTISATGNYYSSRASRTAIGITATGKVVFMVLDGRQEPVSCGGSMAEIAQIMLEAGCVEAINLDGGGSTTYVAKQPGEETFKVINRPSDGFARSVSTSLMAVSTAPSSTAFDHAILESEAKYMTLNNSIQITAKGVSATGDAAELPEGTTWAVSDERWGTITEEGVFTAKRLGDTTVYLKKGDDIIGETTISCVEPNKIYFTRDNIDLVYGSSAELPVKMAYDGKNVAFRPEDVVFTVGNPGGTVEGLQFTAAEKSEFKKTVVVAALASDDSITASINISLFKQGEATFDFDKATAGDRLFAWLREVTNSIFNNNKYEAIDVNEKQTASYVFALDMTQIPIPEKLSELTYMLPGADAEGASAWNFLLQLAERVSVLTEVRPVVYLDKNFDVDYSELTVVNEYFELKDTIYNEEEHSLTLVLNWKDQTQAINPATANPMCILSGVKMTPKDDAEWSAKNQLTANVKGKVSYDIYLRASALYSFAQKPENQEMFGIYPFVNNDVITSAGSAESGGHFAATYTEFEDTFILDKTVKNGWLNENGNFYYYAEGTKLTGIAKVDGLYYDFGEDGACDPDNKYTGFVKDGNQTYYARLGELLKGWNMIDDEWYFFDKETGAAATGDVKMKIVDVNVKYQFDDNGKIIKGYWFHHNSGKTYYYYGPTCYKKAWVDIDGSRYFFDSNGHRAEIGAVIKLTHGQSSEYHLFDKDGKWIRFADDVTGVTHVGSDVYYFENGIAKAAGLVKDADGSYYYINSTLKAVKNCNYALSKGSANGLVPAGVYEFGADGKMVNPPSGEVTPEEPTPDTPKPEEPKPEEPTPDTPGEVKQGLVKDSDGKIRYYKDGIAQYAGVVKDADGYFYYINSSKAAVTNCTYAIGATKTNGLVPAGTYKFGADGKMLNPPSGEVTPEEPKPEEPTPDTPEEVKQGLVKDADGKIRYYVDGVAQYAGVVKDADGNFYYVNSAKAAVVNSTYAIGATKTNGLIPAGVYTFGADGKMVNPPSEESKPEEPKPEEPTPDTPEVKQGLVKDADGKIRYYVDGVAQYAGVVKDDEGNLYYINSTKAAVVNTTYAIGAAKTNGLIPAGSYKFGADGKMIR